MIRALLAFFLLLAAIFAGIQLSKDPGYLLIAINHWTVETTLWFAIFALILLFALMYLVLRLLSRINHSPAYIKQWHERRKKYKARQITRRGLIEFSEGYWQKARQHLIQAIPGTDAPLLNYLTAARAAQNLGDSQLRDDYLRQAQRSMPEAKIAVELTQAELQLANQQWEQALATLRHLQDLAPHHPYVLKLLMHLYQEIQDWQQLILLLPELKKHRVVSQQTYCDLENIAYQQQLAELIRRKDKDAIEHLITALPRSQRYNNLLFADYCQYLINQGQYERAEAELKRLLKNEFNSNLIELYGLCPSNEKQINFAEGFLKKYPHNAALFLCLGELCGHYQLWGKAKSYLQMSLELQPDPLVYARLAKLYEQLHEYQMANDCYKKGLLLSTKGA